VRHRAAAVWPHVGKRGDGERAVAQTQAATRALTHVAFAALQKAAATTVATYLYRRAAAFGTALLRYAGVPSA